MECNKVKHMTGVAVLILHNSFRFLVRPKVAKQHDQSNLELVELRC